jgi:hypothetical protein
VTVPSTSQLVSDALRELAEADREWRGACDAGESGAAYHRVQRAEDRLRDLARVLFPGKTTLQRKPRGKP